jgi:hypothetical protein
VEYPIGQSCLRPFDTLIPSRRIGTDTTSARRSGDRDEQPRRYGG